MDARAQRGGLLAALVAVPPAVFPVAVFLVAFPAAFAHRVLAAPAPEAGEAAAARPPDVLLVTIDTLRADALGFAGNRRVATPNLDRLAAAGRVFPDAHAHNVVTLPSHANILTGLYPYQHGVRDNSGFRLGEEVPTLATVLREAGYATGAFVAAFPLDSQFGLDRGFEVYDDRYPEGSNTSDFLLAERPGDEVVAAALAWWHERRGEPRFLWVHLFDPHAPYDPPEPFASEYVETPYLGEVAATDAFLGPLLAPLRAGEAPPALVVVTSDHGEALGEHGELTHGLFAYEPTLRVPLVLWGHGVEAGVDRRPARHVDILPTVLDALGLPAPEGAPPLAGHSLLGPRPEGEAADTYFEALSATLNRGWAPLRGLIREGKKALALPLAELYDLAKDPAERENLVDSERRTIRALLASLPRESVWPPGRGEISDEERRRLESLGYLSGSAEVKARYGPEDDPKTLVELDRKMHRVIDLYSRGRLSEALPLAREVVEARPSMALGRSLLAQTLLETGATEEALRAMRSAREAGAATDSLLRQLGLTLASSGKAVEALEVLAPLAATGDPRSRNAYGLALSEAGRQEAARVEMEKVLAADPDNPIAFEQLALVELRLGRWAAAREAARQAVRLNPGLFRAWNSLGVALYRLGEAEGALEAWQQAVDLEPELWDALYNLGTKALEQERPEQALAALKAFVARAPAEAYAADLRRARVLVGRLERRLESP